MIVFLFVVLAIQTALKEHYAQIKRYRANAQQNALRAADEDGSREYLSIAQDGTEQLGYGYPKGDESTKVHHRSPFRHECTVCRRRTTFESRPKS
jgi:hypothetical protein